MNSFITALSTGFAILPFDLTRGPRVVELLGGGRGVLATVAAVALLGLLAAAVVPRRRVLTALTGLSLAVVLGATLVPNGGWSWLAVQTDALQRVMVVLQPQPGDLTIWQTTGDGPANVMLFIPLGFCLALLLRRPATAAVLATGLSLLIECYQAAFTTRIGVFTDVVANGLGALTGAVAAALVLVLVWPLSHLRLPRTA